MDTMECQHHGNCGGWCETEEEREMCLCFDCLDAYHDDEEQQKHQAELEKAMQRIACAAGIELAQPGEIADIVCARLVASLAPPNAKLTGDPQLHRGRPVSKANGVERRVMQQVIEAER